MRYTVVYVPTALNELADIWNHAPDQQAVTDAANAIDRRLARSPETQGQPYGGRRSLWIPPLEVVFEVLPDDRLVWVLEVTFVV